MEKGGWLGLVSSWRRVREERSAQQLASSSLD